MSQQQRGGDCARSIDRFEWYPLLLSLLLGVFWLTQVWAAGLEASLDRTRVTEGDSLTLRLAVPNDVQETPDLSVLSQDFDILSQGQNTRMTTINGRSSSTREWEVVIAPKHEGTLTLPAIQLGGLASHPLQVQVLPASQAEQRGEIRPVLLEVETDTKTPYVQGQVVYKVRILSRVPLQQPTLTDPKAANTTFEQLGEDTIYERNRGGRRYRVTERRYAVFPQRSGSLEIEGPVFTARIPDPSGRRMLLHDPFFGIPFGDPFSDAGGLTNPLQVRGRRLTLEVKPQPAAAKGPWLPAKALRLSETWSPEPPHFRVGEPVTRTLAIIAQGLSAAQLPNLSPATPHGITVYPDKPQTETRTEGEDLVAIKMLKQALRPFKEGKLTLPEIRLPWWDTQADQPRVAIIPARTVEVLPAQAGAGNPTTASLPSTPAPQPQPKTRPPASKVVEDAPPSAAPLPWIWITLILGLIWFLTLALWLYERRRRIRQATSGPKPMAPSTGKARARVEQACRMHDAKAAREALLAWGAARWPTHPPRRLDVLAARLGETGTGVLGELDRYLYASATGEWDGTAAWQTLGPLLRNSVDPAQKSKKDALPELYPQGI